MAAPTAVPATAPAASPTPADPPQQIRLQVLDANTPKSTFTDLFYLLGEAFGTSSPIWGHMYPPPRPPVEEQAAVATLQHALDVRNPDNLYVLAIGSFPNGEERPLGLAVWGKPGYRWEPLEEETMSAEQKDAYVGYNLTFRNEWRGTLQQHRDQLMGDELYWYVCSSAGERTTRSSVSPPFVPLLRYLSILAVHPSYQKYKIGSTLIDHGLAFADTENLPVLLESSAAGRRLYESRGFVKEDEFPNCPTYEGMAEMRFPLYRRPAKGGMVQNGGPNGV
ncbi:hypothetical protein QFC19_009465 [Naganishia cerealis]|uniref:Uncharacterized protein n=1 Tax=Naganishia cerealis TaxID=610337 RepID=A0ACC2UV53_9TREE|nr:hypothetical protein QFC19_009465 [Naganishia cerealis]